MTVAYPLKLDQTESLQCACKRLQHLGMTLYAELLEKLWSETTLDQLQQSKQKAYKILGENIIQQTPTGSKLYIPSRMKRAIVEQAGRVIRSQIKKRDCWNDIIKVIQITGRCFKEKKHFIIAFVAILPNL